MIDVLHSSRYPRTFYVRVDGNNNNNGLSNTSDGAWLTINYSINNVKAGDIIRVQAGMYSERITPDVSGNKNYPITLVADGDVTFCGINIINKNYFRFIGFTIDTSAGSCIKSSRVVDLSGTQIGIEFWNNKIQNATISGISGGAYSDRSHNWIIIGNNFAGFDPPSGTSVAIRGNNNFIAYNTIANSDPDDFVIDGNYNYWLNNFTTKTVTGGGHGDVFQAGSSSLGLAFNTFEANFVVGEGNVSDEHGALIQSQGAASCSTGICGNMTENLFRHNIWHNLSGGHLAADTSVTGIISNTREVNDTIVETMRTSGGATYSALLRQGNTGYFFNNINYDAWTIGINNNIQTFVTDTGAIIIEANYNLAFKPNVTLTFAYPWTIQANPRPNINPLFTDISNDNFTIQSLSGARNTGGPLTKVNGNGTGTVFNVVEGGGGWFRGYNNNITTYDGKLTKGDTITIGTTTREISSILEDKITVTVPFTWNDGDLIYLGDTITPDIGALPYKNEYSLSATYSVIGNVVTILPSDNSLVRFIICYVDGIPTKIVNSSPYVCSVSNGFLMVRVYPRYASKISSVLALAA